MGFLKNIETATHLLLTEKLNAPFGQVNMPSYASEKSGGSPRFVAWENNGSVNASLDSIQSQANRIEPIFNNFADLL